MKRSKIAVLGGGSWGTTTASVISRQCDAVLWARDAQIVDEINQDHTNTRYLADATLHPKLTATTAAERRGRARRCRLDCRAQ